MPPHLPRTAKFPGFIAYTSLSFMSLKAVREAHCLSLPSRPFMRLVAFPSFFTPPPERSGSAGVACSKRI